MEDLIWEKNKFLLIKMKLMNKILALFKILNSSFNSRGNTVRIIYCQIYVDASRGKEAMFDRKESSC